MVIGKGRFACVVQEEKIQIRHKKWGNEKSSEISKQKYLKYNKNKDPLTLYWFKDFAEVF